MMEFGLNFGGIWVVSGGKGGNLREFGVSERDG